MFSSGRKPSHCDFESLFGQGLLRKETEVLLFRESLFWQGLAFRKYRIYSNKRRGAYLIFGATSAALI